jgi:hypothetical protein
MPTTAAALNVHFADQQGPSNGKAATKKVRKKRRPTGMSKGAGSLLHNVHFGQDIQPDGPSSDSTAAQKIRARRPTTFMAKEHERTEAVQRAETVLANAVQRAETEAMQRAEARNDRVEYTSDKTRQESKGTTEAQALKKLEREVFELECDCNSVQQQIDEVCFTSLTPLLNLPSLIPSSHLSLISPLLHLSFLLCRWEWSSGRKLGW